MNFHTAAAISRVFRNTIVYKISLKLKKDKNKRFYNGFERIVPVILARILPPDVALLPKDKWISSLAGTFNHLKEQE